MKNSDGVAFKVGDVVKVYSVMNPRTDYLGKRVIKYIGPMHHGPEKMLWFEGGGGAWHPDACEPVEEVRGVRIDRAEEYRSSNPNLPGTKKGDPYGWFHIPFRSVMLNVMVAPIDFENSDWQHVSVSLNNRCPNWPEMCHVKDLFFDEEETVVQFHPKKSSYVNIHNYCLHLWSHKDGFPTPPRHEV